VKPSPSRSSLFSLNKRKFFTKSPPKRGDSITSFSDDMETLEEIHSNDERESYDIDTEKQKSTSVAISAHIRPLKSLRQGPKYKV
jgi:hypothetical protein